MRLGGGRGTGLFRRTPALGLGLALFFLAGAPRDGAAAEKQAPPALRVTGSFAFEVAYDDNIIHYSDPDLYQLANFPNTGKFSITSADDWILRPRLELMFMSRRLTGKPLGVRFRLSYWYYVENDIKNNDSYQVRISHPGPFGRDSFELTGYYAPRAYIRNFRDRPPYAPLTDPAVYTEFSVASNSFGVGYFRRWTGQVESTVNVGRSIRYYNQPFMENDNWEWNVGGNVVYRFTKQYAIRGEYIYSDVDARAADEVGEEPETSDDGDASYDRDSYRIAFEFRPKKNRYRLNGVNVSGQFQDYYYTSEKPLVDDPTHVGRNDRIYRFEGEVDTDPVIGRVALYAGYRYSQRTSTSPAGFVGQDVGEEKDYTDNRTWIGATYPF